MVPKATEFDETMQTIGLLIYAGQNH